MTRTTAFCVAAAFGFVAVLGAQERSTTEQRSGAAAGAAEHEVTLTGCLMRGADGKYELSGAMMASAAATTTAPGAATTAPNSNAPTGTTGTTSGNSAIASTWILENKDSELASHVGEKVEVKGRMISAAASGALDRDKPTASTTAPGAASSTATGTSGSAATANQRLDVQSVKTVSSSCS